MNRKQIVLGMFMCVMVLLSTNVMLAETATREISYGINVMLNGQIVEFDEYSRPFTMGGITFLPLRALAELLDLPVDFDRDTNTLILGSIPATGTPITELFFEGGGNRYATGHGAIHFGNPIMSVSIESSVRMSNNVHNNAIVFDSRSGGTIRQFSLHNLNRQYRFFTGYIGRIDGSAIVDARVRIYGDDRLLATHELRGRDSPRSISLFVEGINILRVEMVYESPPGINQYAFVGFVE